MESSNKPRLQLLILKPALVGIAAIDAALILARRDQLADFSPTVSSTTTFDHARIVNT
jgi:hypothetical protein